jgi:hypothetical protein
LVRRPERGLRGQPDTCDLATEGRRVLTFLGIAIGIAVLLLANVIQ